MKRLMASVFFVAWYPWGVAAAADDPYAAHRIVAARAIDALPADITPLFRAQRERFEEGVIEPGEQWTRDHKLRHCNQWHHVAADLTAVEQTREGRVEACRSFPRDEKEAHGLYQSRAHARQGRLPWAIDECYRQLIDAFEKRDAELVITRAGHLTHFVADGVNPFRLSVNEDGSATGNAILGSVGGIHPRLGYPSVRQRFEVGLFNRFTTEYARGFELGTSDYHPVWEPVPAALDFTEDSLRVLDMVAQADRETLTGLEIVDRKSFDAHADAYFAAMDEACRDACLDRLRAASILAANLIGGAWQTAGSPVLESLRTADEGAAFTGAVPPADPNATIIGSRHSNVFHRRGCQFAKQISADNMVTFASALEARQAGRRACKVCKPE